MSSVLPVWCKLSVPLPVPARLGSLTAPAGTPGNTSRSYLPVLLVPLAQPVSRALDSTE